MDEHTFLSSLASRFLKNAKNLEDLSEKEFQLEVADELLRSHRKVFMEYPFPHSEDKCDIVITEEDIYSPKVWMEIKPMWSTSTYWTPSKFIGEAPFKHDLQKLKKAYRRGARQKAWFLLIAFTKESLDGLGKAEKIQKRKRLTFSQVVQTISKWANCPFAARQRIEVKGMDCTLLLWNLS